MNENGFVKVSRKMLEWGWYDDPYTFKLWLHLLLIVNWKEGNYHGQKVKAGQKITSLRKLANGCGLTIRQTRTSLEHLISTHEIEVERHTFGTLITVIKWAQYQLLVDDSDTRATHGATHERHTSDTRPTHQYRRKEERKKERNKNIAASNSSSLSSKPVDKETEEEKRRILNERFK